MQLPCFPGFLVLLIQLNAMFMEGLLIFQTLALTSSHVPRKELCCLYHDSRCDFYKLLAYSGSPKDQMNPNKWYREIW
jgi:hypothetical protein